MLTTLRTLSENGIRGFFRGVSPRIALGVWRARRTQFSPLCEPRG
jgi:hypothetical protein